MLSPTGLVISQIVSRLTMPTAFKIGSLVTFGANLDLGGPGYIKWGTRATVVSHDFETGIVELELRGATPELAQSWGSYLTLWPFQTEDALVAINAALLSEKLIIQTISRCAEALFMVA
jgi:hypothetical protein